MIYTWDLSFQLIISEHNKKKKITEISEIWILISYFDG